MTRQAADLGELRAAAEVLGHSPEMMMQVYAHALPDSVRSVADRIGRRHGAAHRREPGRRRPFPTGEAPGS